MKPKGY